MLNQIETNVSVIKFLLMVREERDFVFNLLEKSFTTGRLRYG